MKGEEKKPKSEKVGAETCFRTQMPKKGLAVGKEGIENTQNSKVLRNRVEKVERNSAPDTNAEKV
jgi:hypothetical protein